MTDFIPDTFPPSGPTTLLKQVPSYLYEQYNDDDDLLAFVSSFNDMAQQELDWFNQITLPDYRNSLITGTFLDWVALGLYGLARPAVPAGTVVAIGPYNTVIFNTYPYNTLILVGNAQYFVTTDDLFKRILTWQLYKADGKVFNIRWLKRRLMRFLTGANGATPNVDQTYPISVTVSGTVITITIDNTSDTYTQAAFLKAAIDGGAVELPFQFTYSVTITT